MRRWCSDWRAPRSPPLLARALVDDTDGVGLFGATVGAVIVLVLWNHFVAGRRRGVRGVGRRLVS